MERAFTKIKELVFYAGRITTRIDCLDVSLDGVDGVIFVHFKFKTIKVCKPFDSIKNNLQSHARNFHLLIFSRFG